MKKAIIGAVVGTWALAALVAVGMVAMAAVDTVNANHETTPECGYTTAVNGDNHNVVIGLTADEQGVTTLKWTIPTCALPCWPPTVTVSTSPRPTQANARHSTPRRIPQATTITRFARYTVDSTSREDSRLVL